MTTRNLSFDEVGDIFGFRIIVNNTADCYKALYVLHSNYHFIPGSFTDYISTPKDNGYKSIHTSIIGPEKIKIEIQIRTKQMHKEAQFGLATHWCYKEGVYKKKSDKQYKWLQRISEIIDQSANSIDLLETMKLETYQEKIFAFTKDGELITLPHNATVLDFAFALHSQIGLHCVTAKINGMETSNIARVIENGDQIEILVDKNISPKQEWLNYVKTGKAISSIKRFLKK